MRRKKYRDIDALVFVHKSLIFVKGDTCVANHILCPMPRGQSRSMPRKAAFL